MKSKVELAAGECALLIDVEGKMGIEMPELKPEDEGVTVPTNVQLLAGMFLAMQRQNEEIVQNFLSYCMGVFDEELVSGDNDDLGGGVRNDPAASEQVDEQGAA